MCISYKKRVILGAGPAGLCVAYELAKSEVPLRIIEKNDSVGGLSRTLNFNGFMTDIGPHRFYSENAELYALIEHLLKDHWIKVDRLTRFYIKDVYWRYPLQLNELIGKIKLGHLSRILIDIFFERSKQLFRKKEYSAFDEYVIANFGTTLAELNILNYTEKVWGMPCYRISSDWAKQRIKGLSIIEIIKNLFVKSKNGPKTLADQFFYPDTGTQLIYDNIKDAILSTDSHRLLLNSVPTRIFHNGTQVESISVSTNGTTENFNTEVLFSSIPITELVTMLSPAPPGPVIAAAKSLKFRSHVCLFITLNKPSVFKDQWIYFPDNIIPFGRIMEPKNFSRKLSPNGQTSLLIEFFCWKNDNIWNFTAEQLLDLSLPWLAKLNHISKEDVTGKFVHREEYAYPVYDLEYHNHRLVLKEYLRGFDNLLSFGRSGSFKYCNQDSAMMMGIVAATSFLKGERYDIDSVKLTNDYFEKARIYNPAK